MRKRVSSSSSGGEDIDDDRDTLPFVVAERIPDPYTSPCVMARAARANSDVEVIRGRRRNGSRRRNHAGSISASVRSVRSDGSLHRMLGEFAFDSHTNCGDLLLIGDVEYEVVSCRSQFRYAGGGRFALVRKILEVKGVTRIAEEACLGRLMERTGESESGKNFE